MDLSYAEENYLKAIHQQATVSSRPVPTNRLAEALGTSAAAVTDMVQRLHKKKFVTYQKYKGTRPTKAGQAKALQVLRKHLLWEVFLVEKLQLGWEVVHEIAEQLEHVHSPLLIQRLADFLGHPAYGPHGEPIPTAQGQVAAKAALILTRLAASQEGHVVAVKDSSHQFLQYLSKRGIYLGAQLRVIECLPFDQSMEISIDHKPQLNVSHQVSSNILVTLTTEPA